MSPSKKRVRKSDMNTLHLLNLIAAWHISPPLVMGSRGKWSGYGKKEVEGWEKKHIYICICDHDWMRCREV